MKSISKYSSVIMKNILFGIIITKSYFVIFLMSETMGYHVIKNNWYSHALAVLALRYFLLFLLMLVYVYFNTQWFHKLKMQNNTVTIIPYLLLTVPSAFITPVCVILTLHLY